MLNISNATEPQNILYTKLNQNPLYFQRKKRETFYSYIKKIIEKRYILAFRAVTCTYSDLGN